MPDLMLTNINPLTIVEETDSEFELALANIEKSYSEYAADAVKEASEYFLKKQIFSESEITEIIAILPLSQLEDLDEINEETITRFFEARPECYGIILSELAGEIPSDPRYDSFEERDADYKVRKDNDA